MNLVHHSPVPYDIALTEARQSTAAKFEARIEKGRIEGASVIDAILAQTPTDRIVRTEVMRYEPTEKGVNAKLLDEVLTMHDHAIGQFSERHNVPVGYLKGLLKDGKWGQEEAAHTMTTLAANRPRRVLLRDVNTEVRGYLSDSFRRLDCRPIIEALAKAFRDIGALPVGGTATDLRVALRAVFPEVVFVAGDPVLFGLEWRNSDFGVSGNELNLFLERLWCTNKATRESIHRQVHLGARLPDNIRFSDETYRRDTAATASAMTDLVEQYLGRDAIMREAERLTIAAETPVTEKGAKSLLEAKLDKTTAKEAMTVYAQTAGVEKLPQGQTIWRLSNAVSWLANGTQNKERALELQDVAGWLLGQKAQ